jgi:hypothetical protein
MYTIPDRLEVRDSTGQVLYSTNGLVSGTNSIDIPYTNGPIVFVIISAPNSGTAWDYVVSCATAT